MKIGRYAEVGVADARERHFELRTLLERGIDPADASRQELSERKQRAADAVAPADEFETFSKRCFHAGQVAGGAPSNAERSRTMASQDGQLATRPDRKPILAPAGLEGSSDLQMRDGARR